MPNTLPCSFLSTSEDKSELIREDRKPEAVPNPSTQINQSSEKDLLLTSALYPTTVPPQTKTSKEQLIKNKLRCPRRLTAFPVMTPDMPLTSVKIPIHFDAAYILPILLLAKKEVK